MSEITVVDLFCGAGGLSYGFKEDDRYRVLLGADVWEDALETYRHNSPVVGLQVDIANEDPRSLGVDPRQVDVVIGGPPCKGFSLAGERDIDDDRNQLVSRFIDYVEFLNPKVSIMENVVGIKSMDLPGYDNGNVVDYIYERYENLQYNIDHKTLHANDYGIPQTRSRVFFIAGRETTPKFPEPTTQNETQPVKNVLDQDFSTYKNHNKTNHSEKMVNKISDVDFNESVYENYSESWKRIHPENPAPTIKENHGAPFVHPYEDRVGTPRECAAIQTFPNTYVFKGSKSSVLKQIGNAVPPQLSKKVGNLVADEMI